MTTTASRHQHLTERKSKVLDLGPWTCDLGLCLADHTARNALSKWFAGRVPPLAWGLRSEEAADSRELISQLDSLVRQGAAPGNLARSRRLGAALAEQLPSWLREAANAAPNLSLALESLAWCHALPRLAIHADEQAWWSCIHDFLALTEGTAATEWRENPLARQLLAGELSLALAFRFPEIEACRRLADAGRNIVAEGLEAVLDPQGAVYSRWLDEVRLLLASTTRSLLLSQAIGPTRLPPAARLQCARLLRSALQLTRRDGTLVFDTANTKDDPAGTNEFFRAAIRVAGDATDHWLARRSLRGFSAAAPASPRGSASRPSIAAACNSEAAGWAVLRRDWSPSAARLTVDYSGRRFRWELACGDDVVWSGYSSPEIEFDGAALEPRGGWEEVCWVSDDDADYLELEIALSGGVRIQRHLLLPREDGFLFFADAVLADRRGSMRYALTVPLAHQVRFDAAAETREGFLIGHRRHGLVLPLALPEWRSDRRAGELDAGDGSLHLRQAAPQARALFAPLFIDLARRRLGRPATWRQLTVAENREIVPCDLAVGYRVQTARRQWLFYRSLGPCGNRTLLGHNLVSEFLAARFERTGSVDAIMEIEDTDPRCET